MSETALDQVAWERIEKDDPIGLARLHACYAEQLFRTALQRLRNPRDAEELLNDLFLEARQKAGQHSPDGASLGAWLQQRIESRALGRIHNAQAAKRQAATPGPPVDLVLLTDDPDATVCDSEMPGAAQRQITELQLRPAALGNLQGLTRRLACLFDLEANRVLELLALAIDPAAADWQPTPLPRVQRLPFAGGTAVNKADCSLVRLRPRGRIPEHRHLGDEWAMVLQGSIAETDGRQFDVGDIVFSATGSQHALEVNGNTAAVVAVATFGGIDFLR